VQVLKKLISSLAHILTACFLAMFDSVLCLTATITYLCYQFYETESVDEKLGDLKEWVAGIFLGLLIRVLVLIL